MNKDMAEKRYNYHNKKAIYCVEKAIIFPILRMRYHIEKTRKYDVIFNKLRLKGDK